MDNCKYLIIRKGKKMFRNADILRIFRDSFGENKDKYRLVAEKMMLQGCPSLTLFEKISKEGGKFARNTMFQGCSALTSLKKV